MKFDMAVCTVSFWVLLQHSRVCHIDPSHMKMTSSSGEVDKFLKEKLIIEGKVVRMITV